MIENPFTFGWAIAVFICGAVVGLAHGLSAGFKSGTAAAILIWVFLGGIETTWSFFSDRKSARAHREKLRSMDENSAGITS